MYMALLYLSNHKCSTQHDRTKACPEHSERITMAVHSDVQKQGDLSPDEKVFEYFRVALY